MMPQPLNKKINILIVDDERTTRSSINRILSKNNQAFHFDEAENGKAGLAAISERKYDCIILDYLLEDMSGLDFLAQMEKMGFPAPAIMLTSHGDETLAVKSIKSGAYDYLSKTILSRPDFSDIMTRAIFDAVQQYALDQEKKRGRIVLEMSEERYRNLIENSDILIIRFFYEDRIINFVNNGFCRYFNVKRHDVLGETFLNLIPEKEHIRINSLIDSLNKDKNHGQYELHTKTQQGDRWQIWTFQAIFDEADSIIEFQCMGEDITDLKQTELKLSDMLYKVQELKKSQDGDYFLTSLLLEQLSGNCAKSDYFEIRTLVVQKKRFAFRKWIKEIGGDICYTQNISLRGVPYILFLNADAMGKSIQGAGGALVLGAVLQSIIHRTKFSSFEQSMYPEQWIQDAYTELQRVFESFSGTMLVSIVLGIIDEKTGMIYYINAEHPWTVLLREGKASFIEEQLLLRKLGIDPDYSEPLKIKTFRMDKKDMILIGSDGRDDFLILDGQGGSSINEDERYFLSLVEESGGDIDRIHHMITSMGELTDDLSLMSIACKSNAVFRGGHDDGEITAALAEIRSIEASGDTAAAIESCRKALERFKGSGRILKKIIALLMNKKKYEEALPYFESRDAVNPEDTENLYFYSYALWKCVKFKKSVELAARVTLRDPGNVKYLIHLARVLIGVKNYIEADKVLDRILKKEPDNERALKLKKFL